MPIFRAGDVIGFSAGDLLGKLINVSTLGWPFRPLRWRGLTHVGVVDMDGAGVPYLWEATTLCDLPCDYCGRVHSGLQLHRLQYRIAQHRGAVWLYSLRSVLDRLEVQQLQIISQRKHGRAYDAIGAAHSRSLFLGCLVRPFLRERLRSLFCSEYVALAWEAAQVWDTPNVSAWSPNRLMRVAVEVGIVKKPRRLK